MADYEDDWMNPKTHSWTYERPKDGTTYLIEREKFVPTTGYGRVTEWNFWSEHDTKAERDEALTRLRKDHPAWRLRPVTNTVSLGRSNKMVENEHEEALLRRIADLEKQVGRKPRGKAAARGVS